MGVVSLSLKFTADIAGARHQSNPDMEVAKITLTDDVFDDRRFTLAQDDIVTLWAASSSPCESPKVIWIESDQEVILELTVDANGGVGTEIITATVAAGVPFCLASCQAYANYTTNFAGGTLDVLDRVKCKNLGEDDASVRFFAGS